MRQMQTGGNKALSFGKAKAKLVSEKSVKITFADVAGIEEAKARFRRLLIFSRTLRSFRNSAERFPRAYF